MARHAVRVCRVYDDVESDQAVRVLVDRVWPRGVRKDAAGLDYWQKDVAPSTELRKWYAHDTDKFADFARRYRDELDSPAGHQAVRELRERSEGRPLTLLTATKDVEHSHAAVLAEFLRATR
jgi:uncharacterized protein YeaO (DUF488 family)